MKNGVLIADDSAFMRLMLKDILKEEDIPVAGEAVNGNDAVEKFTSLEPTSPSWILQCRERTVSRPSTR